MKDCINGLYQKALTLQVPREPKKGIRPAYGMVVVYGIIPGMETTRRDFMAGAAAAAAFSSVRGGHLLAAAKARRLNILYIMTDDCGPAGEPTNSGIFTREMRPKAVYFMLDDLINREWKTDMAVEAKNGKVTFRGFRGRYRLSWKDKSGRNTSKLVVVK